MRMLALNIWTNIKKKPVVSLIIFLQLAITAFSLYSTVYTQTVLESQNTRVQNAYGANKILAVQPKTDSAKVMEEMMRSQGIGFVSAEETDYSDYTAFRDKINESEIVRSAVQYFIQVDTNYPISEWGITDDSVGYYSFYRNKHVGEDVTFDGKEYPQYSLNTFAVDRNYLDIFGIALNSGRLFSDEEFEDFNPSHIPVILGYDYKDYFSIGDTFKASFMGTPGETPSGDYNEYMTFEVIGFIEKDQFVYLPGGSLPYPLNKYMIIPYYSKSLEEMLELSERYAAYGGGTFRYVNYYLSGLGIGFNKSKHYVASPENESAAIEELLNCLKEAGLDDAYGVVRAYSPEQMADKYAERTALQKYLLIVMLVLAALSLIFSSVNKVADSMKMYSVHVLVGSTVTRIIVYSVLETLIYCVLGFAAGMSWFLVLYPNTDENPAVYNSALLNSVIVSAVFIVATCLCTLLFVALKVKKYSISSLIRGNAAKTAGKAPLYRLLTFIMILLLSVCATFGTNYKWQTDHVDKYQHDFYSNDAYTFYLSRLMQENAPDLKLDYDIEIENYSVDELIRTHYDPLIAPCIRAVYYKGDVEIPEITKGRWFTEEEMNNDCDYVVAGKNVIEDFAEEKDGELFFTYNNKDYKIIGIMGREGHDTTVDNWVFFTLPTILKLNDSAEGTYIVDGSDSNEILKALGMFEKQFTETGLFRADPIPLADIGIDDDVLYQFMIMILLTALIFSAYYIDENMRIFDIKKLVGYSKLMILLDNLIEFIVLSTAAFAAGNLLLFTTSKTMLNEMLFFNSIRFNIPVITASYAGIVFISVLFSIIAVYRAFRGTARDLRRG